MNLYLPADSGDAVFVNGRPYHRVGTAPVLVENGAEMTQIGPADVTGIASYTWDYDENNIFEGETHRTWTPCEMAASYIYGHGGKGEDLTPPNYISAQNLVTVYGSEGSNITLWETPVQCAKTDFIRHGAWTAPASGILRVISFAGCYNGQFLAKYGENMIGRAMKLVDRTYESGAYFSRFGFLLNGVFARPYSVTGNSLAKASLIRVSEGDVVYPGSEGDYICDYETRGTATTGSWPVTIPLSMPWNGIFLPDDYSLSE